MRSKQYQIETKNENPTAEDQADIGAAVRTTNDDKMLQILPLRKVFCPFQTIKILTLREMFCRLPMIFTEIVEKYELVAKESLIFLAKNDQQFSKIAKKLVKTSFCPAERKQLVTRAPRKSIST